MDVVDPNDPLVTCAYDKSHRIRQSRLQYHLTICAKNHRDAKVKRCHYDASHIVKVEEFEQHLLECPAGEVIKKYESDDENTEEAPFVLPVSTSNNTTSISSWETGEYESNNVQSYNPLTAVQNKPIVHASIGLSKAQRKKHRLQERQRYNGLVQK